MANTTRYVVSTRVAPPGIDGETDLAALVPDNAVVRSLKSGAYVLELTEAGLLDLLRRRPGLLVEEDQPLEQLMPMPGLGFRLDDTAPALEFRVLSDNGKTPVSDVSIFAQGIRATYTAKTGADGKASLRVFESALQQIIVSPRANYWSKVLPPPLPGEKTTVTLTPIEAAGAQSWHLELLGVDPGELAASGAGVKVAVIDGGIANHPDLVVAGGANFLGGKDASRFRVDEDGHGTHSAAIIAGRGTGAGIAGVARDAELYSLKVFPGGRLSDLIEAIQWAIDQQIDVINLSLAIAQPSALLAEAVASALEHGIVCVAAAGNDGGAVRQPAAIEGVIAVSAIGHLGAFPEDSAHALRVSAFANAETRLFFANFSNVGPEVAFCAPGVAVVSAVPEGVAAWDGTSISSASVAGLAALALSAYPQLKTGDLRQAIGVREMLAAASQDLGLPAELQGYGTPDAARLLACAALQQGTTRRLDEQREEHRRQLAQIGSELAETRKQIEELLAVSDKGS